MKRQFRILESTQRWRPAAVAIALAAAACASDALVGLSAGERNRRLSAHVGDRIQIVLQTIGPGEYASPPTISSPAVVFSDVAECGNPVPAGPTQCFHFRASQAGVAVLTFAHTGMNLTVQDTVEVR